MLAPTNSFARTRRYTDNHLIAIPAGRNIPTERRQRFRYRLGLSVRFAPSGDGSSMSGKGMIVDMSSGGVLITSGDQPPVGELVEMRIEWPSLLDGRIPLQFIAMGRILRHGPSGFAAAFERHEFRTLKRIATRERVANGARLNEPDL